MTNVHGYEYEIALYYYCAKDEVILNIIGEGGSTIRVRVLRSLGDVSLIRCKLCNGIVDFKLLVDLRQICKKVIITYVGYIDLNKIDFNSCRRHIVANGESIRRIFDLDEFCGRNCREEYRICS